jgi:hypothetical protein
LVIASEHTIWLPSGDDPLQAITCYMESSISANLLAKLQDSFGDKIPIITAAMQPEEALSQYEIEVVDPLTDIVMNNLLCMPIKFSYYIRNLLISSPIARTQQPLKGIATAMQPEGTHSQDEIEVADPVSNVVMNNPLCMPMDFLYNTILLQ